MKSANPEFMEKFFEPNFSLSWNGLMQGKLWQLFTFFLTQPTADGVSFHFFFVLFAKLCLLWFTAISIFEVKGPLHFLSVYLGSALVGAFFVLPILAFYPTASFINLIGPIYGIMVAWIMLHPNSCILLMSRIPFRPTSILGWIFFSNLFFDFLDGKYLEILFYSGCVIACYFYALLLWGCKGPFKKLASLENALLEKTYFLRKAQPKCTIYKFREKP